MTRVTAAIAAALAGAACAAGCGARTGLETASGAGGVSANSTPSSSSSSSSSSSTGGSTPDAGPPVVEDCPIHLKKYIYVVSGQSLHRFDPMTLEITTVGTIHCPLVALSMAIDRRGTAYVTSRSGHLLRVDTETAACETTSYAVDQGGFQTFSLSFATDGAGPAETLYAAQLGEPSKGLAKIDTSSLGLDFIAPFSPAVDDRMELAGTGDGRLFGISLLPRTTGPLPSGSRLVELDKDTGAVLSDVELRAGTSSSSLGFAAWGRLFYLFVAGGGPVPAHVIRYDPSDGSALGVQVSSLNIDGVAASTCASP